MEHNILSPSAQLCVRQLVTIHWAFGWEMFFCGICVKDDFHQTVLWLQWNICKVASASVADCLVQFYFLFSLGYVNHRVLCILCVWSFQTHNWRIYVPGKFMVSVKFLFAINKSLFTHMSTNKNIKGVRNKQVFFLYFSRECTNIFIYYIHSAEAKGKFLFIFFICHVFHEMHYTDI